MLKNFYYWFLLVFLVLCYLYLGGCVVNLISSEVKVDVSIMNFYDQYMVEECVWVGLMINILVVCKNFDIVYFEGGKWGVSVLILLYGYYGDCNNWNWVVY